MTESAVYHLQPANIEEKLQQGEDRQVEVHIVASITLSGIQELATNQTSQEEAVNRHCHHLDKTLVSCLQLASKLSYLYHFLPENRISDFDKFELVKYDCKANLDRLLLKLSFTVISSVFLTSVNVNLLL